MPAPVDVGQLSKGAEDLVQFRSPPKPRPLATAIADYHVHVEIRVSSGHPASMRAAQDQAQDRRIRFGAAYQLLEGPHRHHDPQRVRQLSTGKTGWAATSPAPSAKVPAGLFRASLIRLA